MTPNKTKKGKAKKKIQIGINMFGMISINCKHKEAKKKFGISDKIIKEKRSVCKECFEHTRKKLERLINA